MGAKLFQITFSSPDFPSDNNKGYGVIAPNQFVDQDNVQLSCALSKLNGGREITWKKKEAADGTVIDVKIDNSSGKRDTINECHASLIIAMLTQSY